MSEVFDYVVVGAGAAGGVLASRLAAAGYSVVLLDAGGEPSGLVYDVPAFHGASSQDPDLRWDFWVRHYASQGQQKRDSKYRRSVAVDGVKDAGDASAPRKLVDGVLYPRASGIGGCTAHHALITVYPHDADWRRIEAMTGDSGWSPERMRGRFKSKLEDCRYLTPESPFSAGHGFAEDRENRIDNWLSTELPDAELLFGDPLLLSIFVSAISKWTTGRAISPSKRALIDSLLKRFLQSGHAIVDSRTLLDELLVSLDPNRVEGIESGDEGVFLVPLSTDRRKRVGTRELVAKTSRLYSSGFEVRKHCLVDRVELSKDTAGVWRATGITYFQGKNLYEASPGTHPKIPAGLEKKCVAAKYEVILSAGTFNTPQILMRSGIGPRDILKAHQIEERVSLEGVGKNLHDRYEVALINRFSDSFSVWNGSHLKPDLEDDALKEWRDKQTGLYTTSGATICFVQKSNPALTEADIFIFGMPVYFKGYYPQYHLDALTGGSEEENPSMFTWAVLKKSATTGRHRRGSVSLRSNSPFVCPEINFQYFPDGDADADATAIVEAVRSIRSWVSNGGLEHRRFESEIQPGADKVSDGDLHQWVRDEAWGHHACGTCRIGIDDEKEALEGRTPGVLDSKFRVRSVKGLRVVDASVFPDIPGFFIATSIYLIAEKAAEDILEERKLDR